MNLQTVKTYHDNGNPQEKYTEDGRGQKQGTYRNWYEIGQLCEQCEYVNGERHGTYQYWYSNGQLCTQCELVNGKRHGTYQYWHVNGQLWQQCEYVNGKLHGILYLWDEDGSLMGIKQYDNSNLLVRVDYTTNPIRIEMIDPNIESSGFIAEVTLGLDCEGKKYEFTNN